jgi:hypothetical protein
MSYTQDLKKIMVLYPDFEVLSSEDHKHLINIHNILEATHKDVDRKIVKAAFDNRNSLPLNNTNDYFYLVLKAVIENTDIKKFAYPMLPNAAIEEPTKAYDLDKWAGLVHKIYDAVSAGDMSLFNAIDYYANTLDRDSGESDNFKKWVNYYRGGEHLKYNSTEEDIVKEADFQFPLNGSTPYSDGSGFVPSDVLLELEELNINDGQQERVKKEKDKQEHYDDWKKKLHGAIRRIDKLLRHNEGFLDSDTHKELAELLHSFDLEVRGLREQITAADRAYNMAGRLKKLGLDEGSEILMKFAQEAPTIEDLAPDLENREDVPEPAPEGAEELPGAVPGEAGGGVRVEQSLEGESTALPGEYEELAGEISLEDAATKLEDIAGRLADRRTIRLLAELDIMLDKIGIATMFPELAEAQSKLIDAYTYALTRVTKMLGMVSSGRGITEIAGARKRELSDRTMKEVNKTFEAAEGEEGEAAPEAIREEFEGGVPEVPEAPAPPVEEPLPAPPPVTPEV